MTYAKAFVLAALCFTSSQAAITEETLYSRTDAAAPAILSVTQAQWASLNKTVGGRLAAGRPIGAPCFARYNGKVNNMIDLQQCAAVQQNKSQATFLAGEIGGFMQGNWATCASNGQGCPLFSTIPVDPVNPVASNCQQGQVSSYYIKVAGTSDVVAGMNFAKKHNIPLVIKNSGHDYKGRSAAPNSLALWTHTYQPDIFLTENFVPEGCSASSGKVVTFGAGQGFDGIYRFAEDNNVTVVGGSSMTVGAAGGWITGGGHSALSPTLGLGVDNVQQLKAVTPNGDYVTANRCQNQDLFYALRGGGGSTFAVIMEMTTKAHPQVTLQTANFGDLTLTQSSLKELIAILVANANKWADEGFGGYLLPSAITPAISAITFATPILDFQAANKSMQPLIEFIANLPHPGTGKVTTYPSYYTYYQAQLGGLDNANGGGTLLASRLVPAKTFKDSPSKLVNTLMGFSEDSGVSNGEILPIFICATAPNPKYVKDDGTSSVTPAWRNSTWHVISTTTFENNADPATIADHFKTITNRVQPLRDLTPYSGAYQNEADTFEPDPVGAYWGQANYNRLVGIKKQYDPSNLLTCHQCIGWDQSDSRYSCYPSL